MYEFFADIIDREEIMSVSPLMLTAPVTDENFDEALYLTSNPGVANATRLGKISSGRAHFEIFGRHERRTIRLTKQLADWRKKKFEKIEPLLRLDMPHNITDGKANYLTEGLRKVARIVDTGNVSANGYDGNVIQLIEKHRDGIILDCSAGLRDLYYPNIVNFEIVNYDSTDVLGVGEELPFKDASFDAVISVAVLEHVRDPFRCAKEIARVIKPGGELYCCVPFLQPYHGYPHHYFNMTHQGIQRLFESDFFIESVEVLDSTHPIWSLTWFLQSWAAGLADHVRKGFLKMTVADLIQAPDTLVKDAFCQDLSHEKRLELASAVILRASRSTPT